MPPINVTVDWPTGQTEASVSENPITVPAANGATVIKWTCGVNVASFAITGLDASVFNPSDSNGQGPNFTTNDSNNNANSYTYTVSAVHTSGQGLDDRRQGPFIGNSLPHTRISTPIPN